MTDRIPLDAMTSDQLDALYDQLEGDAELHARNIGTVARERQTYRAAWKEAQRVRAKAEATIARVHDALASFDGRGVLAVGATNLDIPTAGEVLDKVRAALDRPEPAKTGTHVYLSTGCYHGDHAYCKNMTGLNGRKRPGECKHCGAKCICGCHPTEE